MNSVNNSMPPSSLLSMNVDAAANAGLDVPPPPPPLMTPDTAATIQPTPAQGMAPPNPSSNAALLAATNVKDPNDLAFLDFKPQSELDIMQLDTEEDKTGLIPIKMLVKKCRDIYGQEPTDMVGLELSWASWGVAMNKDVRPSPYRFPAFQKQMQDMKNFRNERNQAANMDDTGDDTLGGRGFGMESLMTEPDNFTMGAAAGSGDDLGSTRAVNTHQAGETQQTQMTGGLVTAITPNTQQTLQQEIDHGSIFG